MAFMAKKLDKMKDRTIKNFHGTIWRFKLTSPTTESRDVLHSFSAAMVFDACWVKEI